MSYRDRELRTFPQISGSSRWHAEYMEGKKNHSTPHEDTSYKLLESLPMGQKGVKRMGRRPAPRWQGPRGHGMRLLRLIVLFPTRLLTSEDECKWFWHQMIYFPGTINIVSTHHIIATIYIGTIHSPSSSCTRQLTLCMLAFWSCEGVVFLVH